MAQLRNRTTGEAIAAHVRVARSPWRRAIGFLDRSAVASDEGLWFERCAAVHTFGMRAVIDVVFLGAEQTVLAVVECAAANRVLRGPRGARAVLELSAGTTRGRVRSGDRLELA